MSRVTFFSRHPWFLAAAGFFVGLSAALIPNVFKTTDKPLIPEVREFQSNYQYINPLLACGDENFAQLSNKKTLELEKKIETLTSSLKAKGTISDGAVYFREFNGGTWLGVNEDALFIPGSLLKVPLVMSVYKHAEKEPGFLAKQILYEGGSAPAVEHFTSDTIQPGPYSVEDLVRATLVNSDNNAALLLARLISPEELNDSYSHLGITIPTRGEDYTMPVRVYASFFRILYNATYLDHGPSEHLLQVLSESVFRQGLVAGVPAGTVVAHKFGERSIEGGSSVQLHDCGVVYHPKQSYLLCVMLRGNSSEKLADVIRDISELAYEYAE